MIEPSNAEQALWTDMTRDYVADLKENNQSLINYIENLKFSDHKTILALEAKRKDLEAELAKVKETLKRVEADREMFQCDAAHKEMDWITEKKRADRLQSIVSSLQIGKVDDRGKVKTN